nr:MAG TPA: hypothetical protein [Caudoviricetes sp.]
MKGKRKEILRIARTLFKRLSCRCEGNRTPHAALSAHLILYLLLRYIFENPR